MQYRTQYTSNYIVLLKYSIPRGEPVGEQTVAAKAGNECDPMAMALVGSLSCAFTILTYMADGQTGEALPSLIQASLCRGAMAHADCPVQNIAADPASAQAAKNCAGCTLGTGKVHAPRLYALNHSLTNLVALKGPHELVMFLDGSDVVYGGCEPDASSLEMRLAAKLEATDSLVLFAAETSSWDHPATEGWAWRQFPHRNLSSCRADLEVATVPLKFLNGGMMAGRAGPTLTIVQWVVERWNHASTRSHYNSDQGKFGIFFRTRQRVVKTALDYCGDFFFSTHAIPGRVNVSLENQALYYASDRLPRHRLRSTLTKRITPLCFVHWNGPVAKRQDSYARAMSLFGFKSGLKCTTGGMTLCSYHKTQPARTSELPSRSRGGLESDTAANDPRDATDRPMAAGLVDAMLLVSVSSVPSRFNLLAQTLQELARQTRPPNDTVLVLPKAWEAWRRTWQPLKSSVRLDRLESDVEDGILRLLAGHSSTGGGAGRDYGRGGVLHAFRPAIDYGPVMKLVGALWFLREHPPRPEHINRTFILTVDDDMDYPAWLLENLLSHALRYPSAAVAHAGGDYHGLPSAPEDFAQGQRYVTYGPIPNGWRHRLSPPCTARKVNYILGWAGVVYRPEHFDQLFFDGLADLASTCHWCDDQYISHHLNRRHVPILLPPLPHPRDRFAVRSRESAARGTTKNNTALWMQTARLMMGFRGKGADVEWNTKHSLICIDGCARTASSAQPCTTLSDAPRVYYAQTASVKAE